MSGQTSTVWRVLTTPIGPPILPRFAERKGYTQIVAEAGLPDAVGAAVLATVSKTRLWRGEQADVARELAAHFADGLAAGRAAPDLIRDFGDPAEAARLIRRAKKRGRPLVWRAWVRGVQGSCTLLLLCSLAYGALAVRYFTGTSLVSRDYLNEVAAPLAAVPEEERAWPLYADAVEMLAPVPAELRPSWGGVLPGEELWPGVESYVRGSRGAIEMLHRAAALPRLGVDLRVDQTKSAGHAPPFEDLSQTVRLGHLTTLQRAASLLHQETLRCAGEGDGDGVLRNLTDILRIAQHAGDGPFSIHASTSLSVFSNKALRAVGQVLVAKPEYLDHAQLVELAHLLGAFAGGGTLSIDPGRDRAFFMDLVQRSYTDDGNGYGRLTHEGRERLALSRGGPVNILTRLHTAALPLTSATAASRKEVVEAYDRAIAAAQAEMAKPLHARTDPWGRITASLGTAAAEPVFAWGVLPMVGQLAHQGEIVTQHRDATLVAIALELHRRAHGAYPAALDELSPRYLPRVPMDRFDGGQLKYAVRGGKPLIYSVGSDGTDNVGTLVAGPHGNMSAARWVPRGSRAAEHRPAAGDLILWPPVDYDADGNVIARP